MLNLNDILAARAKTAGASPKDETKGLPPTLTDDLGNATEQLLGHRLSPAKDIDPIKKSELDQKIMALMDKSLLLGKLMKLMPDTPWERSIEAISIAVERGSEAIGRDTPVVVHLILSYLRQADPLLVASCINGGVVVSKMYLDATDKLDAAQKRISELEAEVARLKGEDNGLRQVA